MSGEAREVTVVGAGVVGMACALYLQRDGHAVTVIDREAPGEGCSRGNAGVIAVESVMPLSRPALLRRLPRMLADPASPLALRWRYLPRLLPWLLRFALCARRERMQAATRALAALQATAVADWGPLLERAGAGDLVRGNGWAFAYATDDAFEEDAAEREVQRALGIRVEELDGIELHERFPVLAPGLRHGVVFPDAAWSVDSFRLVQLMAEALVRDGGRLLRTPVYAAEARPGRRVQLATGTGPRWCGTLVLAAGAWSGPLAAQLGSRVPLDTERGYHVMLPAPGLELPMPVMDAEHHFVATSMLGGLRLAGTSELAGLAAPPDWRRARMLLEQGRRLCPGLDGQGASEWMGFRPTLPDSLPVISGSPHHPDVFFAFGHQHLGLTLAAVTGRLMADRIAGRDAGIDLSPYRIDRF